MHTEAEKVVSGVLSLVCNLASSNALFKPWFATERSRGDADIPVNIGRKSVSSHFESIPRRTCTCSHQGQHVIKDHFQSEVV